MTMQINNQDNQEKNKQNENLYTRNIILSEMITGIIAYGIIAQIIIIPVAMIWLDKRIVYYSGGLWIGVAAACFAAIHMNNSISNALDFDESSAVKIVRKDSIIRYIVLLVIFGILMVTNVLSPIVAFIGVMGLKAGAYLQPLTHSILRKAGPKSIKEYIKEDDIRRQQLLDEYYEEQKRLEEEKMQEEKHQES